MVLILSFWTFSVTEFRWFKIIQAIARQCGVLLTTKDIEDTDFATKSQWLRRNPVTAARHIDDKFHKFFHGIVLAPPHPIGQSSFLCSYARFKCTQTS